MSDSLKADLTVAQVMGSYGGGGAERVTVSLARGLAEAGLRSLCIAIREPGPYVADVPGIEVVDLGATSRWGEIRAMARLRRVIRAEDIDLLHVHGQNALPFCVAATRAMRRPPRLWFTWHRPDEVLEERPLRRAAMRWALRRCERLWGDSSHIIERLLARLPKAPPAQVFINGVPERPATPAQALDRAVILWMARLVPTKHPEMMINAAAALRDRGHDFDVILAGSAKPGQEWYEKKLRDRVQELDLDSVISMPGWINDLDPLLDKANIGVQTSSYEGLSLSLLEQMMAGLAIVASDVGDTAVAVKDGETGRLFADRDQAGFEAALESVVSDPTTRRRLAVAGRRRCLETFSTRAMVERTLPLIRSRPTDTSAA